MLLRFCTAVVLVGFLFVPATAQTVRFNTNVGNFDMVLNPDGDANLQVLVDNMLVYVEGGLYDNTVINRAADGLIEGDASDDFVLQMGSFLMDSIFTPSTSSEFTANRVTAPDGVGDVIVDEDNDGNVDFEVASNLRGTVTLALSNGPNTGSSSFFINLNDNSGLDAQGFVPFAEIPDMSTIDLIMQLNNVDVYSQPGNLTLQDIPLLNNDTLVYIEEAFVLAAAPGGSSAILQSVSVPEPPSLVLAIGALVAIYVLKPSKRG